MVDVGDLEIQNPSLSTFLSALIFYAATGVIIVGLFFVVRHRHPLIYAPRSVGCDDDGSDGSHGRSKGPAARRDTRLGQTRIATVVAALFFPDTPVYHAGGPDAAMFLRNLQSGAFQFALFAVIALPVLLPVDATYSNSTSVDLERLTMSSVIHSTARMWAHVGVFAAFSFIAVGIIFRDLQHFVAIRARYMRDSLEGAAPFKATSVMVMGLSRFADDKDALQDALGGQTGDIRGIYPCIDYKDLVGAVDKRDRHIRMLETTVCAFMDAMYYNTRLVLPAVKRQLVRARGSLLHATDQPDEWRLLPILDQLKHHCAQIARLNQRIRTLKARPLDHAFPTRAAFVVFATPQSAQEAVGAVQHTRWWSRKRRQMPFRSRFNGLAPHDVDWPGIGFKRGPERLYTSLLRAVIVVVIVFWGIPVVFVSMLSSLTQLSNVGVFKMVADWPTPLSGFVQGVFPPIILGLLQWCMPDVFCYILSYEARPATWHRDLAMINYLFFFELVDSFLVPVAATTIFMGLPEFLNNPSSLAITIVVKIPTVSTFFMSFVLMRALANGPLELCRAAHIVKYKMLMLFSGKSPRTHARLSMPSAFQYAEHIPSHGLIFLLGQFYSSIAPLMAVTAALHCALFARIFAYKFVHVYDRHTFQLGGRIAQKLLYLRWLALYMSEALFVASIIIRTCSKVDPSSIVQMVITLVVPVATIVLHVIIRRRTYPRLLRPLAADDEASVYSSPPSEASIASASDYQTVRTSPSSVGSRSSTPLIAEHDRSATAAISCSQAMADWAGRQSPLAVDNGASGAPSEKSARSVSADSHDPAAQAAQAIWPAAMSDPGYSLVWLPLLPATCSTRLVDIGAILAQTDATHDARPSPDAPAGEPTWVDARAFMDHLYEAISRWLGQYGRVETAHAELHKRRIRTTTLQPPREPVAALCLHSPLN